MLQLPGLQRRLQKAPYAAFSLYAALVAFAAYSCMYAFRKPFTAALFGEMQYWGIDYKVWLVVAQTVGYAASKFYGIRFIAEMRGEKRGPAIIGLIAASWLALLLFAIVPPPYNIGCLLLNGFPLGMIWGLVFSYLEGRRSTEFMGAVLSVSFIFSSGFVKWAGKTVLLKGHVGEQWMPFITGLLFMAPLVLFVVLLEQLPPPSAADEQLRTRRAPMNREQRRRFIRQFLPGLLMLVTCYVLLTVLRDMRDNFAANIWQEQGMGGDPGLFTATEVPVSLAILLMMGLLVFIKDNGQAFMLNHLLVITGFALAGISTLLFRQHHISTVWWMTLSGLGLYAGYIPFNCILFERLIAAFRHVSNVGFIIYVADSFGYLGSVSFMLLRNLAPLRLSWTVFFQDALLGASVAGIAMIFASTLYFRRKLQGAALVC